MPDTPEPVAQQVLLAEDEVVDWAFAFLARADGLSSLPREAVARATDPGEEAAVYAYEELNRFLQDEELAPDVKVSTQPIQQAEGQKLELFKRRKGGQTEKVVIYRVKGSVIPTALGLAGLTLGVLLLSPALPLTATGFLYGQAKRFVVLQREQDEPALRTYEAFARLELSGGVKHPSTRELAEELDAPLKDVQNSVVSLLAKQVLVVANWGGAPSDYHHPETRWKLPL